MVLRILSGGAAHGLVNAFREQFKSETGADIEGTFGAVGAMRDKLVAGEPVDLLILTAGLIAQLAQDGRVVGETAAKLGVVRTAVAVRTGDPQPAIGDGPALKAALLAADSIYFPDPKLATAGIHFARVLDTLGVAAEAAGRLRTFPNGATAMRALAAHKGGQPIGCTQVTEILDTPGVTLVGVLPPAFELATVYTAAVASKAEHPELARRFAAMLTGEGAREIRLRVGFEA